MRTIVLVPGVFPFGSVTETSFITPEIEPLSRAFDRVIIAPLRKQGEVLDVPLESLPSNVVVSKCMLIDPTPWQKVRGLVSSLWFMVYGLWWFMGSKRRSKGDSAGEGWRNETTEGGSECRGDSAREGWRNETVEGGRGCRGDSAREGCRSTGETAGEGWRNETAEGGSESRVETAEGGCVNGERRGRRRGSLREKVAYTSYVDIIRRNVKKLIKEYGLKLSDTLFYTFWFDFSTAAVSLIPGARVVTRAHGHDLFEDRYYISRYWRKLTLRRLDGVFLVSEAGLEYLRGVYPAFAHKFFLYRLGTVKPLQPIADGSGTALEGCVDGDDSGVASEGCVDGDGSGRASGGRVDGDGSGVDSEGRVDGDGGKVITGENGLVITDGVEMVEGTVTEGDMAQLDAVVKERCQQGVIRLLGISRLSAEKGVVRQFEFVREYALRHPERRVCYTHVGDGALRQEIERIVANSPANLHVVLKGAVHNSEVHRLLSGAVRDSCMGYDGDHDGGTVRDGGMGYDGGGLHDSERGGKFDAMLLLSCSEGGCPIALCEAYSYGVPAVATAVGGISELVSQGGGVLLPATPDYEAFEGALDRVLKDNAALRAEALRVWERGFDAAKLRREFVDRLKSVSLNK